MKVLYVITKAHFGGAQRYVFELASMAKHKGHEVIVVTGKEGELSQRCESVGIRTISLSYLERDISLQKELHALKDLYKIFAKERPDVIHLNSSKIGGLGSVAARFAGVRNIVFTAHGWPFNENRPFLQKSLIWFLSWFTALFSSEVIAVTQKDLRSGKRMPFVGNKISLIPNGVSEFETLNKEGARERLAPNSTQGVWIGTVGELHILNKGTNYLIRAFEKLTNRYPEVKLVMIGDGEDKEKLRRLASDLDLEDKVTFAGHVPEARKYMKAFDVFVLPSIKEGHPFVLLEAGTAKLPVIATNVGGIPDIITSGENGLLVEPRNADALYGALESFLGDKISSTKLGENLSITVREKFSLEKTLDKTFKIYEELNK
jgi:glycosyltransferase involved in cell wall biosynthesis